MSARSWPVASSSGVFPCCGSQWERRTAGDVHARVDRSMTHKRFVQSLYRTTGRDPLARAREVSRRVLGLLFRAPVEEHHSHLERLLRVLLSVAEGARAHDSHVERRPLRLPRCATRGDHPTATRWRGRRGQGSQIAKCGVPSARQLPVRATSITAAAAAAARRLPLCRAACGRPFSGRAPRSPGLRCRRPSKAAPRRGSSGPVWRRYGGQ